MRSKLNYLINISLMRKVATKWFVIVNILLAFLVVGLANIDSIINYFGGDFEEKQIIYVIDNTNKSFDIFKTTMEKTTIPAVDSDASVKYDIKTYENDIKKAKEEIERNKGSWVVIFEPDKDNILNVKIISEGYIDTVSYQILLSVINSTKSSIALSETNIDPDDLSKILTNPTISREYLDETKKSDEENTEMIMSTVFPVVILPFFMLTILLVQMIGAEVNDEKTTRGMEIIISNVSPKTHFFAKIIAGNLFVLIQTLLLLLYSGIGLVLRGFTGANSITNGVGEMIGKTISDIMKTGLGDKLIYIVPLTLLLMIITFIGYSLVAGILASMTTNIEDFQQVQTPIVIVSLVGYYLSMLAALFKGSVLIKAFSFVPFISAILSPSLLVLGYIGVFEVIVAIILMLLTIYVLVKYGLRIYKVGILNYSSSDLWKKMFKALKN